MSTLLATSLDELREIILDELSGTDSEIYLFGSAAAGEFRRTSDIDVAVEPGESLPPGTLAALRERIEKSNIPYRVEIVSLDETSAEFRWRVKSEGTRWSDSDRG